MKKFFLVFIILIMLYGCGNKKELLILSAASLTEVLTEIKDEFTKENPDVNIDISFAGSQACAFQIEQGAKADIFFSANKKYIKKLDEEKLLKSNEEFVENELIVAVSNKNKTISKFKDIFQKDIKIIVAAETVPVGKYTLKMLENISIENSTWVEKFNENIVSKELSVKSVIRKVELDEVDCGIVYKTDINNFNKDLVREIKIDDKYNVRAKYYYGVINSSENDEIINNFLKYLESEKGNMILKKYNFIK